MADPQRDEALEKYKQAVLQHRETDTKLKSLRLNSKEREAEFEKTEDDLKALQSVGQIIGEVLRQIDDERFIVKASSGPRYVRFCIQSFPFWYFNLIIHSNIDLHAINHCPKLIN